MGAGKTKVLVVDDSAFMRKVISKMISSDPELEVVGTARDGVDALGKMRETQPDVITLDVEMPRMNGLETLHAIMSERPTPVIMLSGLTQENADTTMKALSLGAVDFVPKPSGAISLDIEKVKDSLLYKIRIARRAKLRLRLKARSSGVVASASETVNTGHGPVDAVNVFRGQPPSMPGDVKPGAAGAVVVIGSSTGGPGALQEVVPKLPRDLEAGVVIVQHMPQGFTRSLAARLNDLSEMTVKEAEAGDVVAPGMALVAPGGRHLVINGDRTVALSGAPTVHGVRPAVDITLESAVSAFGGNITGVIMTGMGFDGARGIALVKRAGGMAIAQDEETSVVWGMPRAAIEMGNADRVCALDDIANAIVEFVRRKHGKQ